MNRKLASIQTVTAIESIEGADAIELAHVLGWQCVVKKGEFAPGDRGVFFEIDSQPPDDSRFQFLWTPKGQPSPTRPENFRLKTLRLRGALSQGLLMPLRQFPEAARNDPGDDVTELIGVTKWEPVLPARGSAIGPFLPHIPKTDEMRVQSFPDVLDELRGLPYVITLKCDGTSATFGIHPQTGEFTVCGRNWALADDGGNAYWHVARQYRLPELLQERSHLVIQGELVGPGIQKNRLGLKTANMFAFNVFDRDGLRYLDHDEATAFLDDAGVPMVPVVERGDEFSHTLNSLLDLAEGTYPGTKNPREGIVIRPTFERHSEVLGGRLSFKVISNQFLTSGGE